MLVDKRQTDRLTWECILGSLGTSGDQATAPLNFTFCCTSALPLPELIPLLTLLIG